MTQVSRHLLTGLLALSVVTSVSICPVLADGKWEVVRDSEPNAKVHLNYVRFFDGLKGVAHGSGLLLMTRDGGQTWSGKEIYGDGMFVSPDTGIFTNWSADKLGQEITFTLDSGKNWESFRPELPDDLSPDVTRLADIYFVSSREGWAIAEEGFVSFILHTDDGGKLGRSSLTGVYCQTQSGSMTYSFWTQIWGGLVGVSLRTTEGIL